MNSYVLSTNNKNTIMENSSSSDIGLIDSNEVRRGRWVVSNISERNQIQKKKRAVGIKAYVISENKEYILINDPDSDLTTNADWKLQPYLDNNNKIPIENLPMDAMFKTGMCLIWLLGIDQIPNGWHLCDGTNGTPDMRGKFVLMVNDKYPLLSTGGEEKHTLIGTETPLHNHNGSIPTSKISGTNHYHYFGWNSRDNSGRFGYKGQGAYPAFPGGSQLIAWNGSGHDNGLTPIGSHIMNMTTSIGINETTSGTVDFSTGNYGGNQAHNNMPPYIAVNFIMKIDI